ncbi:MAG TPA: Hsp20/alpha crystallin family protein [Spirochaetota bacterium]|nr:Hsp20/alpha crystallin family protein [Spirochaetota bacterium]HPQ55117.1 Hsp20/alpha crystallin family protein [Spirochaetota bacterium]
MNTERENVYNNERENSRCVITPGTDIFETEGEYVIKADVPGLQKENVDITIDNGVLELKGKIDVENETHDLRAEEFRLHDYYRRFTVGDDIDTGAVKAHMENGVLTLVLPKKEEVKPRKIEVLAH